MKRLILILTAAALLLCGCAAPEPAPNSPTASQVAREMGVGLNLGNTFERHINAGGNYEWVYTVGDNTPEDYEQCWGAIVTTQEIIDGIRDAGFNTVRIPVFWGNMMKNNGKWKINPEYLERVAEVVDYCQNAGLYAVINMHHFDAYVVTRYTTDECAEIFYTVWTQIAEYFRDYPYTVVFEGYNEALGGGMFDETGVEVPREEEDAYDLVNKANQAFVDAVRSTGGNNAERVLIASGYWTNIDLTTSEKFVMPTDTVEDRLMVSLHYVDNNMYWAKQIGSQTWLDYIDDQCDKLDEAFTSKGIPVFMGETTSRYGKDQISDRAFEKYDTTEECLEYVLVELLYRGFVPVLWDTNDNFYYRSECTIIDPDEAAVIRKVADSLN